MTQNALSSPPTTVVVRATFTIAPARMGPWIDCRRWSPNSTRAPTTTKKMTMPWLRQASANSTAARARCLPVRSA